MLTRPMRPASTSSLALAEGGEKRLQKPMLKTSPFSSASSHRRSAPRAAQGLVERLGWPAQNRLFREHRQACGEGIAHDVFPRRPRRRQHQHCVQRLVAVHLPVVQIKTAPMQAGDLAANLFIQLRHGDEIDRITGQLQPMQRGKMFSLRHASKTDDTEP